MAEKAKVLPTEKEAYVRSKLDDVAYCVGFFAYQSSRVQLEREDAGEVGHLELARRIGSLAYFDYTGLKALIKPDREWPATILTANAFFEDMMSFEQEVLFLRKPAGEANA